MINNRYQILKSIGEGRSKVFLAHDLFMNRNVALKILPVSAGNDDVQFIREEFLVLKKLQHPNIIRSHDIGTAVEVKKEGITYGVEPASKFISIEYIEGEEIHKFFDRNGSEEFLTNIIGQIADFLFYLHSSNIIYCDLKPENILLDSNTGKLKFIDFGFVTDANKLNSLHKKGTIYYMAPEVLSEKTYDHRADFYSFGMLLYRLVYGSHPFETDDEMSIYKEHLFREFEFPECEYSSDMLDIIKKLLNKSPDKRYRNAYEIAADLGDRHKIDLTRSKVPHVFVINNVALSIINDYLLKEKIDDAILLEGDTGSGKSALVEEIYYNYENILIVNDKTVSLSVPVWKSILTQLLYSSFVYPKIDASLIKKIQHVIQSDNHVSVQDIISTFSLITSRSSFMIILDDVERYDSFTANLLTEIIPIFLVNNIKVIVVENENNNSLLVKNFSVIPRRLQTFTEQQIITFIEKTFSTDYPRRQIVELIKRKSDSLPGNIYQTLQNIFSLGLITISERGIELVDDNDKLALLDKDNEKIFELRFRDLNEDERNITEILSQFKLGLTPEVVAELLALDQKIVDSSIGNLRQNNILREESGPDLYFSSSQMKRYVYGKLKNKKQRHLKNAEIISNLFPEFDKFELARQYELGGDFYNVYKVLHPVAGEAEKIYAFSFAKEVLEDLSRKPLDAEHLINIRKQLINIYWHLGEYKSGLELVNKVAGDGAFKDTLFLEGMKGRFLIGLGEKKEGIRILEDIIGGVEDRYEKSNLQYEIANAKFYLNDIETAKNICEDLIDRNGENEIAAKCYNLLGLIEVNESSDYNEAVRNFEIALTLYKRFNDKLKEAQTAKNIGNIYYLNKKYDKAEEYWNYSLTKNTEIGSLEEEGLLHNNFGILNFFLLEYERAYDHYNRSLSVYKNAGKMEALIWTLYNFAEVAFYGCDYDKSIQYCQKGIELSRKFLIIAELKELYFLMAMIYFTVGSYKHLVKLEKELKSLRDEISEEINLKDLELSISLMSDILSGETLPENQVYEELIDIYMDDPNSDKYLFVYYLYLEKLLQLEEYQKYEDLILSDGFQLHSKNNILHESYKHYFLALRKMNGSPDERSEVLRFLENSFALIEGKSINELSWKVMFKLAEAYWQRGDMNRANEFIFLTKSLITHISQSLSQVRLRNNYLNRYDRKSVLDQLEVWEKFLNKSGTH